jgi:hypothetical protein
LQSIGPARKRDHAPAGLRETPRGGGAKAGAGAGDEDGFRGHGGLPEQNATIAEFAVTRRV